MSFWCYRLDQNSNENVVKILPSNLCSFLGASWKLFGLSGDLVSNILNKEGYWKPKKLPGSPQEATKNFRAEFQKYFRWYFGWNWFFIRTFWNLLTFSYLIIATVRAFFWGFCFDDIFCQIRFDLINSLASLGFFRIQWQTKETWHKRGWGGRR